MGTKIRSDISKRKEYWIPKHRHLELVHFCLQYPEWKERLRDLDGYSKTSSSVVSIPEENGHVGKPVEQVVYEKLYLEERIGMIEAAAKEAGLDLYRYLLKGVTESIGYEALDVPCCKEVYLKLDGCVGVETFGFDRYMNQRFYHSSEWRSIRDYVIARDLGCDLAAAGYDIHGKIYIHHLNPITQKDIAGSRAEIFDPEFLICTTHITHNAIHYGDATLLMTGPIERRPNDTCPWKM